MSLSPDSDAPAAAAKSSVHVIADDEDNTSEGKRDLQGGVLQVDNDAAKAKIG